MLTLKWHVRRGYLSSIDNKKKKLLGSMRAIFRERITFENCLTMTIWMVQFAT